MSVTEIDVHLLNNESMQAFYNLSFLSITCCEHGNRIAKLEIVV
jgi:hypothetical protein